MSNRLDQILSTLSTLTQEVMGMKEETPEVKAGDIVTTLADRFAEGDFDSPNDIWGFIYTEYHDNVKAYIEGRGGRIQ